MVMKSWQLALLLLALTPRMAKAEIRGLYGTKCLEGNGVSAVKDVLIREQQMETVQTIYADQFCEQPSYDFSFSGPYDLDTLSGFLNYGYDSIKLQVLSETTLDQFNAVSLCGFSDWEINVPREVSGLECGGQLIPQRGTRAFDLIRERPIDEAIQLGRITETLDGLSPAARPRDVEELAYYPK